MGDRELAQGVVGGRIVRVSRDQQPLLPGGVPDERLSEGRGPLVGAQPAEAADRRAVRRSPSTGDEVKVEGVGQVQRRTGQSAADPAGGQLVLFGEEVGAVRERVDYVDERHIAVHPFFVRGKVVHRLHQTRPPGGKLPQKGDRLGVAEQPGEHFGPVQVHDVRHSPDQLGEVSGGEPWFVATQPRRNTTAPRAARWLSWSAT
ncbi:hypothetical protein [Streptomyces sp. C]|uniref:hypothetical protein n=1 Tax=Streptomyces sp. C TaxID=253839 RepID=UPI00101B528B|nr:hypothetical protein [Streptomyces sp. C]